ncbi:acetyltransferase [Hymenobacter sp. BT635]|uniref:Acetyltransferase n=1 Tax=Hymenobacter nitidus TaxID=2880929 RepID=A0ABS8A6H2_9BACT|nr:acetyltransferase [Hymenobacter nitidus]MCB2375993.1 acetyltransferase [Hymenobacter nitidus]
MQIVIYGIGKQAQMTHYLFTHDSPDEVVAFCVDAAYLPADNGLFMGLPVVSFESLEDHYAPADYVLHIAIGQVKGRRRVYEAAKARSYSFASYISSKAQTWPDLVVGEHVFIDPICFIHPYVTIGDNAMLLGVIVGHHNYIGSHSTISACTIGGGATIGYGTFIGMGTVINENLVVGSNNIIGSGCLVTRSTADNAVFSAPATKPRAIDASRIAMFRK